MDNKTGWTEPASPFHEGERQIQRRLGVDGFADRLGRGNIRDHMPDQHRAFYEGLPFLILGTADDLDRPWAALVPGRPGFAAAPDAKTLEVTGRFIEGDPAAQGIRAGADVGGLGIEPATRRRNRFNGRIGEVTDGGFRLNVVQAFGNCPQYIQARGIEILEDRIDAPRPAAVTVSDRLEGVATKVIEAADTFYIASRYSENPSDATHGIDVSHRGGRPGFVQVTDGRTLRFPDFSGNQHFNTLGNILLDPRVGLLFPVFETGDLVTLTGRAEILFDGPLVEAFEGAERVVEVTVEALHVLTDALPFKSSFETYSPVLEATGTWAEANTAPDEADTGGYEDFQVVRVEDESETVRSFYLKPLSGAALPPPKPGQFLPIELDIPGETAPVRRTYTISGWDGDSYRLSIKNEGGNAVASPFLHANGETGFRLKALPPAGAFHLDAESPRPVVLISGGIGVTPMIAMLDHLAAEAERTGALRPTTFIHGARHGGEHAFKDHVQRLNAAHEKLTAHVRYSRPRAEDTPGEDFDSDGRIDRDLIRALLALDDYDVYLCGPGAFMQDVFDALLSLGVREERIHYEAFGPATVLKPSAGAARGTPDGAAALPNPGAEAGVNVTFSESGTEAVWTPETGTLLDLAEANGIAAPFSCRSGLCGTCTTKLVSGDVAYDMEPAVPVSEGDALICCSRPRTDGEERQEIVLDL